MKDEKKVMARLCQNELVLLDRLKSDYSTYIALSQNQFFSDQDKTCFREKALQINDRLEKLFVRLFDKYNIPQSMRSTASISFETGDLYITVTGGLM